MTMAPNEVADLIRDVDAFNEAVEDQRLSARRTANVAARSAWTAEVGAVTAEPALTIPPGTAWLPRADRSRGDAGAGTASSFAAPDGHLCGLFAVDIAGFNRACRDDDIQIYVHKRMLTQSGAEVAFITSGYVYHNVICRRPSLVDPAVFQPLSVREKETRMRAWAYIPGALPKR